MMRLLFCYLCYHAFMRLPMPLWIGQRKNPVAWWLLPYAGEWAYRNYGP